jgi:hypothetical protein
MPPSDNIQDVTEEICLNSREGPLVNLRRFDQIHLLSNLNIYVGDNARNGRHFCGPTHCTCLTL